MEIKNVAVIGAGMMGKMIAFVFAAYYSVGLYDVTDVDIPAELRKTTRELVEKDVFTSEEIERRIDRIRFTTDMHSRLVSNADLVVEAVFEDMKLKQRVFAQLEQICRTDCIFCTNSSVMSPSEISSDLAHRERFAGTHFWNPAHLIPLVEVIQSDETSDETAKTIMDVLEYVGKKPVLCKKDVPGFIANRLQHALWREAFYMVENGIADAKTVDDACRYGPGLRWPAMGPMENSDLVGIDLTYNIHKYILKSLADNHEPSYLLEDMLSRGELGMKSGKGWQRWSPEQAAASAADLRSYLIDCNRNNK
jgi:3-hydroxybutyryl-CoA dehydrogenase